MFHYMVQAPRTIPAAAAAEAEPALEGPRRENNAETNSQRQSITFFVYFQSHIYPVLYLLNGQFDMFIISCGIVANMYLSFFRKIT